MAKKLSEQLADLSACARNAEDAAAAAQREAHDMIMARKEQARTAVTTAIEKVNQDLKSVGDTATRNWTAVKAKVAADVDALKRKISERKREIDANLSESSAEELESEAGFAIDYAIASVEQARLAVLDAIAGRVEAEQAKRA